MDFGQKHPGEWEQDEALDDHLWGLVNRSLSEVISASGVEQSSASGDASLQTPDSWSKTAAHRAGRHQT